MPAIRFRHGRNAPHPPETHPRAYASAVLRAVTVSVPATCDYHSGLTFPMFANDYAGDCTEADSGHAIGVFTGEGQGQEVVLTDQDVLTAYSRVTGYDPSQTQPDGSNPTDTGAVIQDVLDDWLRNGIAGHKILAFYQVDHTNLDEIKACVWLLGGVRLGVNLPQSAEDQFNAGRPWDYDPNADNSILGGHDVRIVGYDPAYLYVVTWGQVQPVSWEWVQRFAEEGWVEADGAWVKNGNTPEGLTADALNAAVEQVTHKPGPFPVGPTPTPVPPGPAPVPPAPVVDMADRSLWAAVQPALTHLSHHGAARTVHDAITAWHKSKGF